MVMDLQTPTTNNGETTNPADPKQSDPSIEQQQHQEEEDISMIDSNCSTPYVSAPSSPGRPPLSGFFYSAPASPMHFAAITPAASSSSSSSSVPLSSYEFEFSARFNSTGFGAAGSMSSADELFLNGQIRPMKLSTHLERPQLLAPLLDLEEEEEDDDEVEVFGSSHVVRGRDLRLRDKSLRRRTRSLSPFRNTPFEWTENEDDLEVNAKEAKNKGSSEIEEHQVEEEGDNKMLGLEETTTPSSVSASSSRSSSAGRSSKRWVFLKDFLRSKSEGRSNNKYFWSTISFSPTNKDKKQPLAQSHQGNGTQKKSKGIGTQASSSSSSKKVATGKPANGVGKRRVPASPHELHYKAHRAQAEELRKKTFLPYRQGLLGCLGFSSKGYGAINGFARALNPVSSR